jgi:predicted nuclease of predicted toxin-antitoxin system
MRPSLLADENFPAPSVRALRDHGYDVLSIAESASSIADVAVMEIARRQLRWILTFDRDYGELVFARRLPPPPAIVLFRVSGYSPQEPAILAMRVLSGAEAGQGGFFVVDGRGQRWRSFTHGDAGT